MSLYKWPSQPPLLDANGSAIRCMSTSYGYGSRCERDAVEEHKPGVYDCGEDHYCNRNCCWDGERHRYPYRKQVIDAKPTMSGRKAAIEDMKTSRQS